MSMSKRNTVLAGAIAMAFAGGSAMAASPVGTVPFDGDGSGAGFTIDNAGFDFTNVDAAPCPVGATCTNMTATTDNQLLMREVDTGVERYIQLIITDPSTGDGDFTYEASVSSGGATNSIAAKLIIDDAANEFLSEQAFYRGTLFGGSNTNNTIAVENFQSISGGFQTFDMETTQAPNQGASLLRNGRIQILQAGAGNLGQFGHTIVAGNFQTNAGTLTAGSESITFAAGNAVSATWIGVPAMSGGGPGVILAPGQTQNHDTRTAAQRDFGLLIYRVDGANSPGVGNAGGTPNGLVEPQFSQSAFNVPNVSQARAFSASGITDTGLMYNVDHGSFTGGAAILATDWNATVFGANPY